MPFTNNGVLIADEIDTSEEGTGTGVWINETFFHFFNAGANIGQILVNPGSLQITNDPALPGGSLQLTQVPSAQLATNVLTTTVFLTDKTILLQASDPAGSIHLKSDKLREYDAAGANGYAGGLVPVGGIIMWSGGVGFVPNKWQLCDGTNGTPDLRDKFIVGSGSAYADGATGGEATHILTTAEMPSHAHELGSHTDGTRFRETQTLNLTGALNGIRAGGANPLIEVTNTGGGAAHENRPPYYALAYIMRME